MSCSLNLKNISYSVNSKILFSNISLDLGHKQKVGIVGANGVGKSSLLQIIAGLKFDYTGDLYLFHNKISSKKDYEVFRKDIAYLPQDVRDYFLCPVVIEDIMFSLRVKGESKKSAYKKALKMLKKLDIEHLKNRIILNLSGGEQKIIALASILINEPKIILLDEPTNDLDEYAQEKIINILNNIEKSMIIVSHDNLFLKRVTSSIYKL